VRIFLFLLIYLCVLFLSCVLSLLLIVNEDECIKSNQISPILPPSPSAMHVTPNKSDIAFQVANYDYGASFIKIQQKHDNRQTDAGDEITDPNFLSQTKA